MKKILALFGFILLLAVTIQPETKPVNFDQDVGYSVTQLIAPDFTNSVIESNLESVYQTTAVVYLGDSYVYSSQIAVNDSQLYADRSDLNINNNSNNLQSNFNKGDLTLFQSFWQNPHKNKTGRQADLYRLDIGEIENINIGSV